MRRGGAMYTPRLFSLRKGSASPPFRVAIRSRVKGSSYSQSTPAAGRRRRGSNVALRPQRLWRRWSPHPRGSSCPASIREYPDPDWPMP